MNYNPSLSHHFARNFVEPNLAKPRRWIGKRISRAFVRYSLVLLIGIGATLSWQSYGDEAMEMVRTEVPSLAWLVPVLRPKPPPDEPTPAASPPQLERLELSLLIVRRSIDQLALMVEQLSAKQDQLAAKQDQLSHIATLKSVESPPQSRAVPPRKPPQQPAANSSATQPSSAVYPSRLLVPGPQPPLARMVFCSVINDL